MATKAALYRQALYELNVISQGQPITGDLTERCEEEWGNLYAELDRDNRAPFAPENVPGAYMAPLAKMLAYRASRKFGVDEQTRTTLYNDAFSRANPECAKLRYYRLLSSGSIEGNSEPGALFY